MITYRVTVLNLRLILTNDTFRAITHFMRAVYGDVSLRQKVRSGSDYDTLNRNEQNYW